MYEIFDQLLATDTWPKAHASDKHRFFVALHQVVREPDFSPDKMGHYFRSKIPTAFEGDWNRHPMRSAVDHYVAAATAVRTYLSVTQEMAATR